MLRRLAVNTAITGAAFAVTGFIPLLLVPLLIKQYGLTQYGLLVLGRTLLPTGALGFLDFGKPETTSFAVARARHDGDWDRCGRVVASMLILALCVSIPASAVLAVASPWICDVLAKDAASRPAFSQVVLASAIFLPPFLCALVAEGVLKGFEDFKTLRSVEVTSALVYAGAAVVCVVLQWPFQVVAFAFLASVLLRGIVIALRAASLLAGKRSRLGRPSAEDWHASRVRWLPLAGNRAIGAIQGFGAPLLIGVLLETAAVGVYDLVTRIPKFLKIATGVLSSAVLPVVQRLDAAGDAAGVRRVFDLGLLGVVCCVATIVSWGMSFSEAILRLWVSPGYASLWPWQALMFVWPLANAAISFTGGALVARPGFVRKLNWIALAQIASQVVLSLALMPWLAERAFVAGQIAVICASLPLQLHVVGRESGMHLRDFRRHILAVSLFMLLVATCFAVGASHQLPNIAALAASLAGWIVLSGLMVWSAIFNRTDRRLVLALLPGGRPKPPAA